VRLWDSRTHSRAAAFRVHEDFVADLHFTGEARNALLSASGDGTLAHLDLRSNKVVARSDNQEDELLSGACPRALPRAPASAAGDETRVATHSLRGTMGALYMLKFPRLRDGLLRAYDAAAPSLTPAAVTLMKQGRKIVTGSQEGVLSLFDWGDIADLSDRYPGHPQSVDALVALNDDLLLTGSSDGVIRVISILPNKMLGVVGEHSEWPVERLCLSPDGGLLASAVRARGRARGGGERPTSLAPTSRTTTV